ncbi:MAG: hypothetical protein WCK48_02515 [bacterium]
MKKLTTLISYSTYFALVLIISLFLTVSVRASTGYLAVQQYYTNSTLWPYYYSTAGNITINQGDWLYLKTITTWAGSQYMGQTGWTNVSWRVTGCPTGGTCTFQYANNGSNGLDATIYSNYGYDALYTISGNITPGTYIVTFQVYEYPLNGVGKMVPVTSTFTITVQNPIPVLGTPDLKITSVPWPSGSGNYGWFTAGYYTNTDGPVEVPQIWGPYNNLPIGATYGLSWGAIANASGGCTLSSGYLLTGNPSVAINPNGGTSSASPYIPNPYTYYSSTITCSGANGQKTSDTVKVTIPPTPTNLVLSCPAPGTQVNASWTLPAGYTQSYFSVSPTFDIYNPSFQNTSAGTSQSFASTPGQTYYIWVATKNSANAANGGFAIDSVTCPAAPPTITTFTANPVSGTSGFNTNLYWLTTNTPTSCNISGGWTGAVTPTTEGNKVISGINTNSTYTITCSNASGSASKSASVTVYSQLNVNVTKTYGGSVKSITSGSPDGLINCGATCTKKYDQGSTVTLRAYPDSAQWRFSGWQGDCIGKNDCVLPNIAAAKNVSALFSLQPLQYQDF